MRNYCIGVILMAQISSGILFAQVTTPNGAQVDYIIYSEGNIALLEAQATQWLSERGWTAYVTKIGGATSTYNCHSYAWYKSEGGSNNYWINAFLNSDLSAFNPYSYSSIPPAPNNINKYWNDCSYIQIGTEAEATKVWFGSCWQWTGYEWVNNCDHSAIRLPSGLYESKWGAWPLYRHPADKCPYTITNRQYFKRGPYISGPSIVCSSGAAFTVNNLPAGSSIIWETGSYLQRVSLQGSNPCTFSSTGSGSGWVRATITGSCGNFTLPQNNVWAGTPVVSVTGPDEGYPNIQYTFQAHTVNPAYTYPFSYSWDMYPYDGYISTSQGGNYAAYGYFTFYHVYSANGYRVMARAQNDCGTGAYGETSIWIHDYWLLSPNPASETVTLTKKVPDTNIESDVEKINTIYTVRIIDFYGVLHYSTTRSGQNFTIPIANLKDGNYIVQIDDGKNTTNLQLVVKH